MYDGGVLESSSLSSSITEAQSDGGVVALASITYVWHNVSNSFQVNDSITAGSQLSPAIAALTGGNYVTAWDQPTNDFVQGRVMNGRVRQSWRATGWTRRNPRHCAGAYPYGNKTLVTVMNATDASPSARVAAASALLDRGWGRPQQSIKAEGVFDMMSNALQALSERLHREQGTEQSSPLKTCAIDGLAGGGYCAVW